MRAQMRMVRLIANGTENCTLFPKFGRYDWNLRVDILGEVCVALSRYAPRQQAWPCLVKKKQNL